MKDIPALLYNFAILAGTTYVVIQYEWSMWCYLLAMCFIVTRTENKDERT